MIFELTGGFALSLALLLTVSIGNGISQAVLGRSFFQAQLESRGLVLHEGPHRVLMKNVCVADFMQAPIEGETDVLPEDKRELALCADDTLETALRVFDTSGAEHVPVVDPNDRGKIVGWASQVRALAWFNKELIASSIEEHR
jgi:CIC family chloride channel protein